MSVLLVIDDFSGDFAAVSRLLLIGGGSLSVAFSGSGQQALAGDAMAIGPVSQVPPTPREEDHDALRAAEETAVNVSAPPGVVEAAVVDAAHRASVAASELLAQMNEAGCGDNGTDVGASGAKSADDLGPLLTPDGRRAFAPRTSNVSTLSASTSEVSQTTVYSTSATAASRVVPRDSIGSSLESALTSSAGGRSSARASARMANDGGQLSQTSRFKRTSGSQGAEPSPESSFDASADDSDGHMSVPRVHKLTRQRTRGKIAAGALVAGLPLLGNAPKDRTKDERARELMMFGRPSSASAGDSSASLSDESGEAGRQARAAVLAAVPIDSLAAVAPRGGSGGGDVVNADASAEPDTAPVPPRLATRGRSLLDFALSGTGAGAGESPSGIPSPHPPRRAFKVNAVAPIAAGDGEVSRLGALGHLSTTQDYADMLSTKQDGSDEERAVAPLMPRIKLGEHTDETGPGAGLPSSASPVTADQVSTTGGGLSAVASDTELSGAGASSRRKTVEASSFTTAADAVDRDDSSSLDGVASAGRRGGNLSGGGGGRNPAARAVEVSRALISRALTLGSTSDTGIGSTVDDDSQLQRRTRVQLAPTAGQAEDSGPLKARKGGVTLDGAYAVDGLRLVFRDERLRLAYFDGTLLSRMFMVVFTFVMSVVLQIECFIAIAMEPTGTGDRNGQDIIVSRGQMLAIYLGGIFPFYALVAASWL